jgi:hypothetical protein
MEAEEQKNQQQKQEDRNRYRDALLWEALLLGFERVRWL